MVKKLSNYYEKYDCAFDWIRYKGLATWYKEIMKQEKMRRKRQKLVSTIDRQLPYFLLYSLVGNCLRLPVIFYDLQKNYFRDPLR